MRVGFPSNAARAEIVGLGSDSSPLPPHSIAFWGRFHPCLLRHAVEAVPQTAEAGVESEGATSSFPRDLQRDRFDEMQEKLEHT